MANFINKKKSTFNANIVCIKNVLIAESLNISLFNYKNKSNLCLKPIKNDSCLSNINLNLLNSLKNKKFLFENIDQTNHFLCSSFEMASLAKYNQRFYQTKNFDKFTNFLHLKTNQKIQLNNKNYSSESGFEYAKL